jgi:outer membrane protein assembly factor BamB
MPGASLRRCPLILAVVLSACVPALAGPWPQWRGPRGDGVGDETGLPMRWDETTGVLWKCPLPGPGASTPAVWNDAIFLTAQQGDKLLLLKIDKADGRIAWTRQVGSGTAVRKAPFRHEQKFHKLHNLASPSPVTDGEVVIAHFGTGDLAAYDFAGKQLWSRNLQKEHGTYTIWWGHANSPVLWKDLVISACMQDSLADLQADPAASYLVAHDKRTGEQKWKTPRMTGARAEDCDSYTTPLFRPAGGRIEMIVMGGNQLDAYDPATGKQLWSFRGIHGSRVITGPTLGGDTVYATAGKRGALIALRAGGAGKLADDAVAWSRKEGTPDSPCPVVWKGLLFLVSDNGIAQCLDARTGEPKWSQRLGGDFKASPLAADGKVYFLNRSGKCTVVAAAEQFEKVAENKIDDGTTASPAVAGGRIYLRGKQALYCIGAK